MNLIEMKKVLLELQAMGIKKERLRSRLLEQVKLDPDNADLYLKLGLYYLSINDIHEALRNFKQLILLNPGNEHAWFIQGQILENAKLYGQAFQSYYFAYRLGSMVARQKLLNFCHSRWTSLLNDEQKKIINQFKESVC